MTKRQIYTAIFSILAIPFLRVPAFAHGDRVFPHVVDGVQGNGIRYRTKFDISNISYHLNTVITKVTVYFHKPDGSAWTVAIKDPVTGNTLNVSSYTLNLGSSQTIRLETLGTGSLADGYVVIRNLEPATELPDDGEIAVTVYYEVLAGNGDVVDTVSVPASQPTVSWTFPVEIDTVANLQTGYALVNLSDSSGSVTIDLFQTKSPLTGDAGIADLSLQVTLSNSQKKVGFLSLRDFFQSVPAKFKGMAVASSTAPVAFLSLLQTPSPVAGDPSRVQFATLVPTNLDSLRRNTVMYVQQDYSLDADLMISDFYRDTTSAEDVYYETPWDLMFLTGNTRAQRSLVPHGGALLYSFGAKTEQEFDSIGLDTLRNLDSSFTTNSIDLSDSTGRLVQGYTFAIKTGLGRYVKLRVRTYVTYSDVLDKDLILEIYTYR